LFGEPFWDKVSFDFGNYSPSGLCSWRGSYEELSIEHSNDRITFIEFQKMIENAKGQSFEGWKGGEYTMDENTPVWVAEAGTMGHTVVHDIILTENNGVIIETRFGEYS
jgi:hypothetical protein